MSDEHKEGHGDEHGEGEHKKGHGGHGGGHGGGGHEEHAGAPEWLISFADNVALLMGFFVILLAMNMNKPKPGHGMGGEKEGASASNDQLNELIYGIREAFHNLPSLDSKDPKDAPLLEYMERRAKGETSEDGALGLKARQQAIKPSDYSAPTGVFPFDTNSTIVSSSNRELARQLGQRLRGQNYIIEIRGHVSAVESAGGHAAAMDLAYRRALSVGTALISNGLKPQNLRYVACGDNERKTAIASDKSEHKTNQRVEIVVTNVTVAADPHATTAKPDEQE